MLRNLIISIVIGLIGYELASLIAGGFSLPASGTEIGQLIIFIASAFAAVVIADTGPVPGDASPDSRELGTVKWFNVRKGYGFITRDQGDDVFVHFRNIEGKDRRAISEGQRVSFVVTSGDKGPQADQVLPA